MLIIDNIGSREKLKIDDASFYSESFLNGSILPCDIVEYVK